MKKLIVLAVASLFATSAIAGEWKWSGSAAVRRTNKTEDDGLSSTNNTGSSATNAGFGKDVSKKHTRTFDARMNVGFTGGWENVEVGADLRTGNNAAANSDWQSLGNNGLNPAIHIGEVWARYVRNFGSVDFSLTAGRQKTVFAYDMKSENFFDNDVRWDGFGWKLNMGMFGMNIGQYITGSKQRGTNQNAASYAFTDASDAVANTHSHFNALYGFQPHMTWKFSDEIETMFAVGYYRWVDDSQTNQTMGGFDTANTLNTGSVTPISSAAFRIHNPTQFQIMNTWTLPYNLSFSAEWVKNKTSKYDNASISGWAPTGVPTPEVTSSAWAAGLSYGKAAKAHEFSVSYYYGKKGIASVISAYSNSSFHPDNQGHTFKAKYALADNFVLGWTGMWLKEVEKLNANGASATGVAYAGTKANQELSTKYMEFTAGVSF